MPDIFELFRFDSANNLRLIYDNGANAPPAYFATAPVNHGGNVLANYGQNNDPSDFFSTTPTDDPF